MNYRPMVRLVISVLERPEDQARAYAVIVDPSTGESGVYLDGVPWESEFFPGAAAPRHMPGPLGVVSITTSETMQGHSASLSMLLGEVGQALRRRVRPHDPVLVEIFEPSTRRWRSACDGHITNVQWTRRSSPGSYRWRMDMTVAGLQKVFSEQWLDWQAMIRAADTKGFNSASKGFSFFHDLARKKPDAPVSNLVRDFITGAVDQFLEFGVRGQRAGIGRTFQTAPDGRDWQSAFDLFVFNTQQWYLMQQGPIWGLLLGLAEPDVHEFYISYAPDPSRTEADFRDMPTIVFRPRPWPGPPAAAITAAGGFEGDDDSLWRLLDVVKTGLPGQGPAAFSVGTSRSDAARANAFFISLSGASDASPAAMSAAKLALGFRVDESLVKRYGFSMRQVSIGSYLKRVDEYFETILPSVLDRVAWQEAPLPFLLDQTRTFPLMAGVRVGSILEDYSESLSEPTTGYIISVTHSINATPRGLHAETMIGTTRALEGVTADGYPTAVRKLVALTNQRFLDGPGMDQLRADFRSPLHSQPAAVNPIPGTDDLLVTEHPNLQDTPSVEVSANLALLKRYGIDPVRALLGSFTLTSVYRSLALNRFVGGREDSDHMRGLAFDLQVPGDAAAQAEAHAKLVAHKVTLGFKECVLETKGGKTWIHYAIPPAGGPAAARVGTASTGE